MVDTKISGFLCIVLSGLFFAVVYAGAEAVGEAPVGMKYLRWSVSSFRNLIRLIERRFCVIAGYKKHQYGDQEWLII